MFCKEVRKALKKALTQTDWVVDFDPHNESPESIWVGWKRFDDDAWRRTDQYVISFEVNEEALKNSQIIIKESVDLSSRKNPGGKTVEGRTRKFEIRELNNIDAVVAKIKEEIPFKNDPIPSVTVHRIPKSYSKK